MWPWYRLHAGPTRDGARRGVKERAREREKEGEARTWLMRRRVLDVIRSPKEFLRMPRPGTNPPRRMGNDTAGPRFLFVKRQPQRRCPVVFGPGGSLASLLLGMIIYLQMRPPSSPLSLRRSPSPSYPTSSPLPSCLPSSFCPVPCSLLDVGARRCWTLFRKRNWWGEKKCVCKVA